AVAGPSRSSRSRHLHSAAPSPRREATASWNRITAVLSARPSASPEFGGPTGSGRGGSPDFRLDRDVLCARYLAMSFFPLRFILGQEMARGNDSPGRRRVAPVVTLLLLAPIGSEVLYGATRISAIFVLVPQVATWGCGALLIREAVVRGRRGWAGLLLLGVALAVAEECVIQQTSLAPMVGLASREYGPALGVNWVYLLWALGYESVWVIVLPVRLSELIFPDRRKEPWVGKRGLILASLAFLLGSFVAWYSWTQVARTKVFHMPEYQPPIVYVLVASGSIVLLVAAAFGPWTSPRSGGPRSGRPAPDPRLVGAIAFLFGLPWSALVLLAYGAVPTVPFEMTLIAGVAWIGAILFLFVRWTSSPSWDD